MSDQLTPKQIEDLQDGWHVAITLGVGDLDTLHAHLKFADCDESGKRLWDDIQRQIKAQQFLARVRRELETETA